MAFHFLYYLLSVFNESDYSKEVDMSLLIYISIAIVAGVITWIMRGLYLQNKYGAKPGKVQELRENLQNMQNELNRLEERNEWFRTENEKLNVQLQQERQSWIKIQTEHASLEADYKNLEERLREHKQEVEQLQLQFADRFKNLANEILEEKSKKFTEQNKSNLDQLLKPLNERIRDFEQKVMQTHKDGETSRAALIQQIKDLRDLNNKVTQEANNLANALKGQTKTQGNWGEMILEKILEKSGLEKGREYVVQESLRSDDGRRLQPDIVVKLPEDRNVIIDSKVSLKAYERYYSAENEKEKEKALKEHISSIQTHVKGLSSKSYQKLYQINNPDFVLMFIPIESAFGLAVQHESSLYNDAFERNVVIVSPSTLLATLFTINNIWKQERQNQNAQEIARQSGALYDKFVGFTEDMLKLGERMDQARRSYDDALNKLSTGRGNLVRRAERIRKLGAGVSKPLPPGLLSDETDEEE